MHLFIMVHTTCAVRECMSSSRINKNLKFHQFPHTEERCKIWIEACDRPDLVGKTSDSLRNTHICSLHFEEHMYGKKSLKKTAIPVLLLPVKGTRSIHTQTEINISNDLDYPSSKISRVTETKKCVDGSTQTDAKLADQTPRKIKLRKELFEASKKLKLSDEIYKDITEKQFLTGCDKFLSPQLAAIVKAQLHSKPDCKEKE